MVIDYKEYTAKDNQALDTKMEHPELEVACPRCGKPLRYHEGSSYCEVRCETPDCLRDVLRGI
jgi:hypothetical protein